MSSTPSFIYLGNDTNVNETYSDEGEGAWTQVTKKKVQKKDSKRNLSGQNNNHRRHSYGGSTKSRGKRDGSSIGQSSQNSSERVDHENREKGTSKKSFKSSITSSTSRRRSDSFDYRNIEKEVILNSRAKDLLKRWNYMCRNANAAYDDIYYFCEVESSDELCAQAIELVKSHLTDLIALESRMKIQQDAYESSINNHPVEPESVNSVAWEVRKLTSTDQPPRKNSLSLLDRRDKAALSLDSEDPTWDMCFDVPTTSKSVPVANNSVWNRKPNIIADSQSAGTVPVVTTKPDPLPEKIKVDAGDIVVVEGVLQHSEPSVTESSQRELHETEEEEGASSIYTFSDDATSRVSHMRWGDEEVGLTPESAAMLGHISPKSNPGYRRSLHDKLSSPERRKPSPIETKRRQVEKQATAKLNRDKMDLYRRAKIQLQSTRQEQAAKAKEDEMQDRERAISEKMERAAVAREKKLKSVAKRAEIESIKVNEVLFINEMTELDKNAQLQRKMADGEKRRQEFICSIRGKAEKQHERAEARRIREEDRERQLREAMVKRHSDAEKRKQEAMEQNKRRLGSTEATMKVNERRTEMEREREAKLALIKEREERALLLRMRRLLARRAVGTTSDSPRRLTWDHDSSHSHGDEAMDEFEKTLLREEREAAEELLVQQQAMKPKLKKVKNTLHKMTLKYAQTKDENAVPLSQSRETQYLATVRKQVEKGGVMQGSARLKFPKLVQSHVDVLIERDPVLAIRAIVACNEINGDLLVDLGRKSLCMVKLMEYSQSLLTTTNSEDDEIIELCFSIIKGFLCTKTIPLEIRSEVAKACIYSSLLIRFLHMCSVTLNIHSRSLLSTTNMMKQGFATLECIAILSMYSECVGLHEIFLQLCQAGLVERVVCVVVAGFVVVADENRSNSSMKYTQTLKIDANILSSHCSGLRMLNIVGLLDMQLFQSQLGSPALSFELQQLLRYAFNISMSDNRTLPNPPRTRWAAKEPSFLGKTASREDFFAELIVLMGFYAQCNKANQESLNWGRAPTPLFLMTQMPVRYFVSQTGRDILFPALISACYDNDTSLHIVSQECNPLLFSGFLSHRLENEDLRFPLHEIQNAISYFRGK